MFALGFVAFFGLLQSQPRDDADLRALLRNGSSDEQIAASLGLVWQQRADRYSEQRAELRAERALHPEAPAGHKVETHYIGG